MAVAKITMQTIAGLAPGSYVSDTIVQGFGVRRQTDGAYYYLRFQNNALVDRQHRPTWLALDTRHRAQ